MLKSQIYVWYEDTVGFLFVKKKRTVILSTTPESRTVTVIRVPGT